MKIGFLSMGKYPYTQENGYTFARGRERDCPFLLFLSRGKRIYIFVFRICMRGMYVFCARIFPLTGIVRCTIFLIKKEKNNDMGRNVLLVDSVVKDIMEQPDPLSSSGQYDFLAGAKRNISSNRSKLWINSSQPIPPPQEALVGSSPLQRNW